MLWNIDQIAAIPLSFLVVGIRSRILPSSHAATFSGHMPPITSPSPTPARQETVSSVPGQLFFHPPTLIFIIELLRTHARNRGTYMTHYLPPTLFHRNFGARMQAYSRIRFTFKHRIWQSTEHYWPHPAVKWTSTKYFLKSWNRHLIVRITRITLTFRKSNWRKSQKHQSSEGKQMWSSSF